MEQQELIPHLFRTEFSKITAVICRHFGLEHLGEAEDIASDTFLAALENWPYQGIPKNPQAWLYRVAKNKAANQLHRKNIFSGSISPALRSVTPEENFPDLDLSDQHAIDSQLHMLFAICHPSIAPEAQVALALRVLCGFGIEEIANALLSNKTTINKRLFRAREKLREEKVSIAWPPDEEIGRRLEAVLTTLYLLFNEGYYSESQNEVLREDLCLEAMRLVHLLTTHPPTHLPPVNALLSLMCFHASRFKARKNERGELVLYADQDESRWNQELIRRGAYYLVEASKGNQLSTYHIEANIAYWHTVKADSAGKWEQILHLFNHLLSIRYSAIAALNRTYALSRVEGKEVAIREAEKLDLRHNHYYYTLLGELYTGIDNNKAIGHYQQALSIAVTQTDRHILRKKIEELTNAKG